MTEHQMQASLIAWFRLQFPVYAKHLFAIPNGGERHPAVAAKLRAEGVLPGVSDLFLIKSSKGYPGMFLELKIKGNKPTQHQLDFIERARDEGYLCVVAYSLEEAMAAIRGYLQ